MDPDVRPVRVRLAGALAVVLALAGCGSGGSDTAPTTTAPPATTTTSPEPLIRQYASAVALAEPTLAKQGSCTPLVDCAMEGAAAYLQLVSSFEELGGIGEAPDEIVKLADLILVSDSIVRPEIQALADCSKTAAACTTEAVTVQQVLSAVSDELPAWDPYL